MVFPAIVQYLTPQIGMYLACDIHLAFELFLAKRCHYSGFPWAVRCAGFVALFFSVIINLLLRPRLPPRKSGPIIEWAAFLEPAYVLFSIGVFLMFWALYFGFFYVRLSSPLPPPISAELIMITDQYLRPPSNRLHRPRISKSPPYP